jgi:multiple sugar transport system permease protein
MSQAHSDTALMAIADKQKKRTRAIGLSVLGLIYAFLIFVCFWQIFPFYLKVVSSFTGRDFIPQYGTVYFFPPQFSPSNYIEAWVKGELGRGLLNSVIHTVSVVTLTLIIAFIFGYVLGKIKFRGRRVIFIMILATIMVPGEVLMIPNFLLVQRIGWYNNLAGIIFPGLVNIFGIYLFRQFMNTIPDSLLESADMDGANELTKIFRIVLPMCTPVIMTYIILTFTATWNEYLWPMIVLSTPANRTLQLRMNQFYPRYPNTHADQYVRSAGMILISLPIIILYLTQQKHFMQSINISGIK